MKTLKVHAISRTVFTLRKALSGLVVTALLTLLSAGAPASNAHAQSATPDVSAAPHVTDVSGDTTHGQPRWTLFFAEQVQKLLASGDPERIDSAMQLIMHYERRSDITIDFTPVISALLEIYEDDSVVDGRRLLALSTLEAVGGEWVMRRLADRMRHGHERSERVERQTLRVLTARLHERSRNGTK